YRERHLACVRDLAMSSHHPNAGGRRKVSELHPRADFGLAAEDGLTKEVVTMAKFAVIGGYTAEAWSKMIDNPGDRVAAVQKVAQAAGGKLEQFFWSFGDDDYLAIIDAPDDISAAAVSIAVGSSASLRNLRTIRLITPE